MINNFPCYVAVSTLSGRPLKVLGANLYVTNALMPTGQHDS